MMNRLDPELFAACFRCFVADRLPGKVDQIAVDGKTSRRSHDSGKGQAALHLVSAYATTHNLVLGQVGVLEKSNEITAIPVLLQYLAMSGALTGALVSIDAMGCQSSIAAAIVDQGGDYLLATKDNQKTAHSEIKLYFDSAPIGEIEVEESVEKNHGRLEIRRHTVSHHVSWMSGKQRYPDEPKFKNIKTIGRIETMIESASGLKTETRCYISSRVLNAAAFAKAVRSHWAIENSLHWVLDVEFGEDQSRLRRGHGAKNMAIVRHFALNLVRTDPSKRSLKGKRKLASWDDTFLKSILGIKTC